MVARIKIGSNVVAGNFPLQRPLQRNHPLGRNPPSVQPHGNLRLTDALACQAREPLGDRNLTTEFVDRLLDRTDTHMEADYNTGSVIGVNTRSAIALFQTERMARNGETSDFWLRLARARREHHPPLGVRQEDVAKDYGVYQSAVTKWKTGKSMPKPAQVRNMAATLNVSLEWLNSGRGDMRPPVATDPITLQVVEAMNALKPEAKVEVLRAAILQQTLQMPAIAAQVEQAQKSAEKLIRPTPKKTG